MLKGAKMPHGLSDIILKSSLKNDHFVFFKCTFHNQTLQEHQRVVQHQQHKRKLHLTRRLCLTVTSPGCDMFQVKTPNHHLNFNDLQNRLFLFKKNTACA